MWARDRGPHGHPVDGITDREDLASGQSHSHKTAGIVFAASRFPPMTDIDSVPEFAILQLFEFNFPSSFVSDPNQMCGAQIFKAITIRGGINILVAYPAKPRPA